jgi:hypothetical protein
MHITLLHRMCHLIRINRVRLRSWHTYIYMSDIKLNHIPEVLVPSHESKRSCIDVLVYWFCLFLKFGDYNLYFAPTVCYFLFSILTWITSYLYLNHCYLFIVSLVVLLLVIIRLLLLWIIFGILRKKLKIPEIRSRISEQDR